MQRQPKDNEKKKTMNQKINWNVTFNILKKRSRNIEDKQENF